MQTYDSYKDSGIDWLGEIPSHWEVIRIKSLSVVKRGASPRPIDDPRYFDDNGEYSWVRIADVTASDKYLMETTQKMSKLGARYSVKREPGDIFLSIAGSVGKPIITKIKCCIHDGFVYFPEYKSNIDFLYRIFENKVCFEGLGKFGTQLNLNSETVGNIYIPYPSIHEQEAIARFLDDKCAKVDELVAIKEQQIVKLKELRQVKIHQAVTKGINPNVEMKDSGIDWIGEIPKHWEVKRFGSFLSPYSQKNMAQLTLLSITREKGVIIRDKENQDENHNYIPDDLSGYKHVKIGQFAMNKMKAWQGSYGISKYEGIVSPAYYVFDVLIDINLDFFNWAIRSSSYISFFGQASDGVRIGQWDLSLSRMKDIRFVIPPLPEQEAIVVYLEEVNGKIDQAIAQREAQIEKLKAYKQSLINEVVTGKVKVC